MRAGIEDGEVVLTPVERAAPSVRWGPAQRFGGNPWCLSRDGSDVAFVTENELTLRNLADGTARALPIPLGEFVPLSIAALPDGAYLVLATSPDEWFPTTRIWRVDAGGTVTMTFETRRMLYGMAASPDGSQLAFTEFRDEGDAWLLTREP